MIRRNGSLSGPNAWEKNTCHGHGRTLALRAFNASHSSHHKSLQGASGLVVKRNVLKRFERVDLLRKRNQWKPGDRVQGLRKTKPDI